MFWRVCASISWTFPESAQVFLVAAQVCTAFKPCRPEFRGPGSGFRVLLACGSSCWRAVALIPQTFSLNTGDPAQPGAPISRAGPVEARPGGAVPGQSRPGPAAPSRASRGPARRRQCPAVVEARPGGAVQGWSRQRSALASAKNVLVANKWLLLLLH